MAQSPEDSADVAAWFNTCSCVGLAIIGGLFTSMGSNIIAYVTKLERFGGTSPPTWVRVLLFCANIIISLCGVFCFIAASGYGPVALAMPILTASKLLHSMSFQIHYKLAQYTKPMKGGTLVLAAAAFCLMGVGPTEPTQPIDAIRNISMPIGRTWLIAMVVILLGAIVELIRQREPRGEVLMILYSVVVAISTAVAATVGKMLTETSGALFTICIIFYLCLGAISMVGGALAAASLEMSIFLPVSECLQLLVNCFTGLFVWGDLARIQAPIGYAMVYVLICIGVYLCASLDTPVECNHHMAGQPFLRAMFPKRRQAEAKLKEEFDGLDFTDPSTAAVELRKFLRRHATMGSIQIGPLCELCAVLTESREKQLDSVLKSWLDDHVIGQQHAGRTESLPSTRSLFMPLIPQKWSSDTDGISRQWSRDTVG